MTSQNMPLTIDKNSTDWLAGWNQAGQPKGSRIETEMPTWQQNRKGDYLWMLNHVILLHRVSQS